MVLAGGATTRWLDQSPLIELLEVLKAADVDDRILQAATTIYQALIEAELTPVNGAAPNERAETRALRNGPHPKTIGTVAGDLELRTPKLRTGSFFPSLLERRRRVDQSCSRCSRRRICTARPPQSR
jgi:transposase-like protein